MKKFLLFLVLISVILLYFFTNFYNVNNKVIIKKEVKYKKLYFTNELIFSKNNFSNFFHNLSIDEKVLIDIKNKCFLNNTLNIPCISYLLYNKYNISYIRDSDDTLITPDEFIKRKGGDCEDYSLFFTYLIYYFSRNYGISEIKYLINKNKSNVNLYREGNIEYILKNKKYEKINNIHKFGGICFEINRTLGHCVIYINNILIEPQNGEKIGRIINNSTVLFENKEKRIIVLFNQDKLAVNKWGFWTIS